MGLALAVALLLTRVSAPYGRHGRAGWGPPVPARMAWCVMEIVTLIGFGACFLSGNEQASPGVLFLCMYGGHYLYRSLLYPWLSPPGGAGAPVSVVTMAIVFNLINSTILGGWLYVVGPPAETMDVQMLLGLGVFILGFFVHVRSDAILRGLRRKNGPGYYIPYGFLYRWVSCPNYLGEIIQWCGFAIAIHALAGWTFAVWTMGNLLPRALRHHRWYRERFSDYPTSRRALIPGVL